MSLEEKKAKEKEMDEKRIKDDFDKDTNFLKEIEKQYECNDPKSCLQKIIEEFKDEYGLSDINAIKDQCGEDYDVYREFILVMYGSTLIY